MYEFRGITDRISQMRHLIRNRVIRVDASIVAAVTESDKKHRDVMPIIKKSLIALDVVKTLEFEIEDFELVVGSKSKYFCGSFVQPRTRGIGLGINQVESGEWTLREDGLYHSPEEDEVQMCISPEDVEILRQYRGYWKDKNLGAMAQASAPDGYEDFKKINASDYGEIPLLRIGAGHLIAGYPKIINTGYAALRKQADTWLEEHRGRMMGEDVYKYPFYKAASLMCQAAEIFCLKFAEAAERKQKTTTDEKRLAELKMIEESLRWLSQNPARNFFEAVQGIMMYQNFLHIFDHYPSMSIGRFDRYVWPFLKKELEEGTITTEYAQEIVDSFFLKTNCFYGGTNGKSRLFQTTGVGITYQHTTIGGVDPATGEDATNPVTYMVLETMGRLLLHDPTISLRINKNSPDKLWDCALATSKLVGGLPLFQNDERIIPGIIKELGWEIEDARDYGIIGCQEIVGCGNDFPAGNGMPAPHASMHYGVALSMALNDGINPFNGERCPIHTGYLYEMNNIEEVREAYRKITEYVFNWHITLNNFTEMFMPYFWPQPALSLSIEGCMEQGKDIVSGGAKHNSYGGTATGLATIADSLTTIKYMCFDKKLCTTRELYDAVMANWEGYEGLRQRIKEEVPHFGNADPYADMEMKWCIDTYLEQCDSVYSVRAKKYKGGLYGAADHIAQGYHTWATPDGRKTGEPIADAASPVQGHDKNGPTAVFTSSLCYDHSRFMDGVALNLRIHPTVLSNQEGIDKLRDVTKAYFEEGGLEVQYNIVDTATLRKAQADPSNYRDLVVRIAGYSAYFVEMGKALQDDVISRHENLL